jgi:SAM-dependent methyltransferase
LAAGEGEPRPRVAYYIAITASCVAVTVEYLLGMGLYDAPSLWIMSGLTAVGPMILAQATSDSERLLENGDVPASDRSGLHESISLPNGRRDKGRMSTKVLRFRTTQAVPVLLRNKHSILDLLPDSMEEVTVLDAEYHAESRYQWIENNQMGTERNLYAHRRVIDEVARQLDDRAVILELAGGVGFDADLFLRRTDHFTCYILSELSPSLLEYARENNRLLADKSVVLCCLDANQILIDDNQVDVVYTVAALHHFPHLERAIREMDRVLKPGGRIVFGIEPNFFWMQTITWLRPVFRRLFPAKAHSAADEVADGFVMDDFARIASIAGWELEKVLPGWFFTGFAHFGLESIFRMLRLPRRLRLPRAIERLFLMADKGVFLLPYSRRFAWHYTAVFRKPEAAS